MIKNIDTERRIRRLLVVEDEHTLAFALKETLKDAGYDVTVANDGDQALKMFRAHPYDVVVTDLKMPGISGIELLQSVKELSPATEVIVVTAYGTLDTAIEALRLHAFDFIMKPYHVNRLRDSVKSALEWSFKKAKNKGILRPLRPVHGIINGSEQISVSWDNGCEEDITYTLDVCSLDGRVNLFFFDTTLEIIKRRQDILAEIRGFVRNGFLRGKAQREIKMELKDYIEKAYGIIKDWRFFAVQHDYQSENLTVDWEGTQHHLKFESHTERVIKVLENLSAQKLQNGFIEYRAEFAGGDSLIFLPAKTYEYIRRYVGTVEFGAVAERICGANHGETAEKIRESISGGNEMTSPGILIATSKLGRVLETGKLNKTQRNLFLS